MPHSIKLLHEVIVRLFLPPCCGSARLSVAISAEFSGIGHLIDGMIPNTPREMKEMVQTTLQEFSTTILITAEPQVILGLPSTAAY